MKDIAGNRKEDASKMVFLQKLISSLIKNLLQTIGNQNSEFPLSTVSVPTYHILDTVNLDKDSFTNIG
ncbi:MAG: hypothetical protein WCR46_00160 [Deltaproteobacteria bacterium]|jgi:hypothetical protein